MIIACKICEGTKLFKGNVCPLCNGSGIEDTEKFHRQNRLIDTLNALIDTVTINSFDMQDIIDDMPKLKGE